MSGERVAGAGMSALAAALVMAVGMGFGRFSYTGVYPVMVHEGMLSIHDGTLAASANYAGYLLGALMAMRLKPGNAHRLCLMALAATVACLAVLALVRAPWLIIAIRGLGGVVSAFAMVGASLWLLQHRGHSRGAPMLYAGVGLGIVLSSELLVAGQAFGLHSPALWLALAAGALVLGAAAMPGLDARPMAEPPPHAGAPEAKPAAVFSARRLIVLYGLAGFGYIITATYLPLLVKDAFGSVNPIQVWALFGLGAIPSCFIWHAIHLRLGTRPALFLNLALQGIGVLLPAVSATPLGYLGSALMVGSTFMGTPTISMLAARRIAHTMQTSILAAMTASFGVGQIAGPMIASALYARMQSFSLALQAAGAALALAALLCIEFKKIDTGLNRT